MKALYLLALVLCGGCQIEKFVPPPYAAAVIVHGRFFGLDASIPTGSGTTSVGVKLGWGSTTFTVIPVCTNQTFAPAISDTFKIGQALSPFNTTITEDVQTGWTGQPPVPRLIFNPKP